MVLKYYDAKIKDNKKIFTLHVPALSEDNARNCCIDLGKILSIKPSELEDISLNTINS